MKKLFIIPSAVLCAALLLSSCEKTTPAQPLNEETPVSQSQFMDSIYNPDAPYIYEKLSSVEELNFVGETVKANKFFVVTKDAYLNTRVYSTVTGKEMFKVNDVIQKTETTQEDQSTVSEYTLSDYSVFNMAQGDFQILAVSSVKINKVSYPIGDPSLPDETTVTMSVSFSDAAGNVFYTASDAMLKAAIGSHENISQYMNSALTYGSSDLFSIGNSVFSYDKTTGKVTAVRDFDTTAIPSIFFMSDEYYYAAGSESYTLQIFDGGLNRVSNAILPEDTELSEATYGALPNGNVVIQYRKELPTDSTEYDIIRVEELNGRSESHKYDLVTLLITSATGEVASIDVSFVINSVVDLDLLDKLSGTDEYKRSFNDASVIADIDYITEDKELVNGYTYSDTVVLSSECAIAHSLKRKSRWIDIPKIIGDGIFSVRTLNDEIEIIDRDGNIIFTYGTALAGKSSTVIKTDKAIYNVLTGKKIIDASEKNVYIKSTSCKIFVVQENNELSVVLADGSIRVLGTLNQNGKSIDDFYASNLGYYYTVNSGTGQYEYFNEYGEQLGIFDNKLEYIGEAHGGYAFYDSANGKYYKMTTVKVSNR